MRADSRRSRRSKRPANPKRAARPTKSEPAFARSGAPSARSAVVFDVVALVLALRVGFFALHGAALAASRSERAVAGLVGADGGRHREQALRIGGAACRAVRRLVQ